MRFGKGELRRVHMKEGAAWGLLTGGRYLGVGDVDRGDHIGCVAAHQASGRCPWPTADVENASALLRNSVDQLIDKCLARLSLRFRVCIPIAEIIKATVFVILPIMAAGERAIIQAYNAFSCG